MHDGVVPKGGGVPLLAAVMLALATVWLVSGPPAAAAIHIFAAAALLAVLSWVDDTRGLSAAIRLPVHLAVAAFAVLSLPADALIFQGHLPFAADRALGAIALAWMMNLFNFMDGINGIAATQATFISFGYVAVGLVLGTSLPLEALAASMAGAAAGFLVWNGREKPLLFLGDAGSVPLGFLTGMLLIELAVAGHGAAAIILPLFFLFDATWTLLKRIAAGETFWEAHRSHLYQRAALATGAHLPVVARVAIADAGFVAAALLSLSRPWTGLGIAALVLAALVFSLETSARSRFSGSGPSRR